LAEYSGRLLWIHQALKENYGLWQERISRDALESGSGDANGTNRGLASSGW